MLSGSFIQFISQNLNLFEHSPLSEPLFLFLFLKNLYHKILPNLNEFTIVDELTFNSIVGDFDDALNDNSSSSHTSIVFLNTNNLLTETQKNLLKIILNLNVLNEEERGYFKSFMIYYSDEVEGASYIVISESQVYYIVNELRSILFNKRNSLNIDEKTVLYKCNKYNKLLKDKELFCNIISQVEGELASIVNINILKASLCFFLLHINSAYTGVSKRLIKLLNHNNPATLFNYYLILNRLLFLHPKQVNLWEIKTVLTDLWFRRFNLRLKRCVINKNGRLSIKPLLSNFIYKHLVRIICKLFTDKLILSDKSFIYQVLSSKPYNNNVVCYLRHQYECVVNYVINSFLFQIKSFNNLSGLKKFQQFTYSTLENRYRIILSNAVFKLFSEFYKRLLSSFSFPGLFTLFVNLIKDRSYSKMQYSVINYSDLYTSSFLYTRLDETTEDTIRLCDQMIKVDTQNCWIENKSKLLFNLLDLNGLKPFYFDPELLLLIFKFKIATIFNHHLSTWHVFTVSLSNIYCTDIDNDTKSARLCKIAKKKNEVIKKLGCKIDEYKSESLLIKRLILSDSKGNKLGHLDGYGPVIAKYVYLDSMVLLKRFNYVELDHILNSCNQLLGVLILLFRNIYKLKRKTTINLLMENFKLLIETIELVFSYSRILPGLGPKVNTLVGIRLIKRMKALARSLLYKYHKVVDARDDDEYHMDTLIVKLSLILLSSPFRFYLHWSVASQSKMELLHKQVLKLK